jgi:hypothetical protein
VLRAMAFKVDNVLPLRLILPMEIHDVAVDLKGRFKLVRIAGPVALLVCTSMQVSASSVPSLYTHTCTLFSYPCPPISYADHFFVGCYSHIRLQASETRRISLDLFATIGTVSNSAHSSTQLGKAWMLGRRPTVRGVAMHEYVCSLSRDGLFAALCFRRCTFRYTQFFPGFFLPSPRYRY